MELWLSVDEMRQIYNNGVNKFASIYIIAELIGGGIEALEYVADKLGLEVAPLSPWHKRHGIPAELVCEDLPSSRRGG